MLVTQHVKESADLRQSYETKLQDIHLQREAQKEEVRKSLEAKLEEMQSRFDRERQDLQSINRKREDQLALELETARKEVAEYEKKVKVVES